MKENAHTDKLVGRGREGGRENSKSGNEQVHRAKELRHLGHQLDPFWGGLAVRILLKLAFEAAKASPELFNNPNDCGWAAADVGPNGNLVLRLDGRQLLNKGVDQTRGANAGKELVDRQQERLNFFNELDPPKVGGVEEVVLFDAVFETTNNGLLAFDAVEETVVPPILHLFLDQTLVLLLDACQLLAETQPNGVNLFAQLGLVAGENGWQLVNLLVQLNLANPLVFVEVELDDLRVIHSSLLHKDLANRLLVGKGSRDFLGLKAEEAVLQQLFKGIRRGEQVLSVKGFNMLDSRNTHRQKNVGVVLNRGRHCEISRIVLIILIIYTNQFLI